MSRSAPPAARAPLPPTGGRVDRRRQILDAATAVFARSGYHGSRVSDIAREAGIAYGLVYHYFENKEEILRSVFEERFQSFLEVVVAIASRPTPAEDRLLSVAALILGGYRRQPDWVKVFTLEIQRTSRFAEPEQLRAVGRLFRLVARILRDGQERGELRRDLDPDLACYAFIGGLEIIVTSLVLDLLRVEGDADAYYLKVAQTVVETFLRGARSGGADG